MTQDKDVWKLTRKLGTFEAALVSVKVDEYVHIAYQGKTGEFSFNVEEAQFLHQSLGMLLSCLPDEQETPPSPQTPDEDKSDAPAPANPKTLRRSPPNMAGRRWDEQEDQKLRAAYEQGNDIDALSKNHERSPAAIISRLVKLDLVEVNAK